MCIEVIKLRINFIFNLLKSPSSCQKNKLLKVGRPCKDKERECLFVPPLRQCPQDKGILARTQKGMVLGFKGLEMFFIKILKILIFLDFVS